jgi:hypothetical protein
MNITLSADEELIEHARMLAKSQLQAGGHVP